MHIAVPGAVAHLFHIQHALDQGEVDRVWLFPSFYCDPVDWKVLSLQAASRLAHLVGIIWQEPTHLGFCDAPGIGVGGLWIYLSGTGHNLVWRPPCPEGVTSD